jgi:ParB/RepB/Spo0J family partition protein
MANKRQMLKPSDAPSLDIDAMLSAADGVFELSSPVRDGVIIKLTLKTFSGEDIINKTTTSEVNRRKQEWLNKKSLAPLIRSLKRSGGQVSPAIGRVDGENTSIIYGSRRRLSTYYANYPYKVLVSDDITDEEAKIISDAENVSAHISLIERGEQWRYYHDEKNMGYRTIAKDIEAGEVSHTLIKTGIEGAKIPKDIIELYPSVNCIGSPAIKKLTKALYHKAAQDISEHIHTNHSDIVQTLADTFAYDTDVNCKALTKAICDFSMPVFVQEKKWPKGINVNTDEKGAISALEFDNTLSPAQENKLKAFLSTLIT